MVGRIWGYYLVYPKNSGINLLSDSLVTAYVAGKLPTTMKELVDSKEIEKHIPITSPAILQHEGYLPPVWVENPSGAVLDYNRDNVISWSNPTLLEFCRSRGREGKIEHRVHMETMYGHRRQRENEEKAAMQKDKTTAVNHPGWANHFVIGETPVTREEYVARTSKEGFAMPQHQDNEILELYLLRRWKDYITDGEWITKVSGLHFTDVENVLTNHSKFGVECQNDKYDYYLYDKKTAQIYLWLYRDRQIVSTRPRAVLSTAEKRQLGLTADFIDSSNYLKTDGVKLREKTEAYRDAEVPLGRFLVGLNPATKVQSVIGYLTNLHGEEEFYTYYSEEVLRGHFHLPSNFNFHLANHTFYWVENPSGKVFTFNNKPRDYPQGLLDFCLTETNNDGSNGDDDVELYVLKSPEMDTVENKGWTIIGKWEVSIKGKNLKDIHEFFVKNVDNMMTREGGEKFYFYNKKTDVLYREFALDNLYPVLPGIGLLKETYKALDKAIEEGTIGEMVTPAAKTSEKVYYIDNVKVSKDEFESRTKVVEAKVMTMSDIEKALGFPIILKK